MSASNPVNPETSTQQAKKPGILAKVLAWIGLLWGVLCILTGLFGEPGLAGSLAMLLVGIAFVLPSGWWMYCAAQDRKAIDHFEDTLRTNEHLSQFLTVEDSLVMQGMGGVQPPRKKERRWPIVSITSIILFVLGAVVMPVEPGATTGNAGTGSSVTDTSTSNTSSLTPSTSSSQSQPLTTRDTASETSRSSAAEESRRLEREEEQRIRAEEERQKREAEEAERARIAELERQQREAEQTERARIAEQERIQREQQQQFVAPAPAQRVSYANCRDVWNRLGRPIYPSDPGYTAGPRKLDGNSDGVGCEQDPR